MSHFPLPLLPVEFYNYLYAGTYPFGRLLYSSVFFGPFTMLIGWVVHVYSTESPFRVVLGAPLLILAISSNTFLIFIYTSVFKIVKALSITLVEFPYFSVSVGLGSINSSSLEYFMNRSFVFSNLDVRVFSAIILALLGSIIIHSFSDDVIFYFLVEF